MTVVSLDMAYLREVLAGLDTRLDTPPSTKRRHPDSGIALDKGARTRTWEWRNPVDKRSLPCCVDGMSEGATCKARLGHDVVLLRRPERRLTQDVLDPPDIDRILA
jgi:hypothetical protein